MRILYALCALLMAGCGSDEPTDVDGNNDWNGGVFINDSGMTADQGSEDSGEADIGGTVDAGGAIDVGETDAGAEPDAGRTDQSVEFVNGQLYVGGQPFFIQGVAWSPVAAGDNIGDIDFAGYVEQDSQMMAAAGLNVVRTYRAITDQAVLDTLYARGIYVINSVFIGAGDTPQEVTSRVQAVDGHPAILMWGIGNEWNYNGLYAGLSPEESITRLNEAAAAIRTADPTTPIAAIYGELPPVETIEAMPLVDVWGINSYRGISLYDLFEKWEERSDKPMFLAEFGADAWNANIPAEDQAAQAEATVALIGEVSDNRVSSGGACLGGVLFEWADEWWKDPAGSLDVQDVGGIAPGGGPHPDQTFNEEWWGLVTIDRQPRQAYRDLPAVW